MNMTNQKPVFTFLMRSCFLALCALLLAPAAAQASATDDTALFWSISKGGEPAGFLLGTIHSEDPRVLDFSTGFSELLATNQVFAMEMVPDLPTLQELTAFMQYQDGSTLEGHIGPERFARLQTALTRYNIPADWVTRMKVWAAMMTLSVPPPQSGLFMDFSLSLRAAGAGLKVVGLETLDQQLAFLEEMPMEQQLALLDQGLEEYGQVDQLHDEMVNSYLTGDLQALGVQAEEQLAGLGEEARQYFMREGIEMRNQRMVETLVPLLAIDRVFVAVGALHLAGNNGIIGLLRDQGYELKPLPLPFSVEMQASAQESTQR